jgi:hypothetical protein
VKMRIGLKRLLLLIPLLFFFKTAFAQSENEKEAAARLEIGFAPSRSLSDSGSSFGPSFAVETTPLPNWLEIEVGMTVSFSRHSTDWGTDFLFKKPWDISPTIEFMAGVGPEWIHSSSNGVHVNSLAGEAVLDFMFWRTPAHKIGWYFEPSYEHSFQSGHEKSLGFSIGLLIGIGSH